VKHNPVIVGEDDSIAVVQEDSEDSSLDSGEESSASETE